MKKTKEKQLDGNIATQNPLTKGLRGHQSVRVTFRLSEACIETISILSAHLGIKQKSVFDHLLEDVEVLKTVANDLTDTELDAKDRIQKTFVINRRSLFYLNTISHNHNVTKEALVESSVRRLLPILANERKNHEKRKQLQNEISKHFESGMKLLSKAEEALDREDPIVSMLKSAMGAYESALNDIIGFIEKGKMIEEFASN